MGEFRNSSQQTINGFHHLAEHMDHESRLQDPVWKDMHYLYLDLAAICRILATKV
jgi:hypothetical protein